MKRTDSDEISSDNWLARLCAGCPGNPKRKWKTLKTVPGGIFYALLGKRWQHCLPDSHSDDWAVHLVATLLRKQGHGYGVWSQVGRIAFRRHHDQSFAACAKFVPRLCTATSWQEAFRSETYWYRAFSEIVPFEELHHNMTESITQARHWRIDNEGESAAVPPPQMFCDN